MNSVKRYGFYVSIYIGIGIAALFTHYMQTSPYNKAELDEKLTLVAASHFALSQLVDNLPVVFRENAHAAALKISDLKGGFLGAMYDERRMTASEYRKFLELKSFTADTSPLPGYAMLVWESKRRRLRIVALSLNRAPLSEYLSRMGGSYALHYLIPLYVLFGFGLLALYHFFVADKRGMKAAVVGSWFRGKAPKSAGIAVADKIKMPPKTTAHAWRLKSGALAESDIYTALATLRTVAGAIAVSLFARKNSAWLSSSPPWQGVAEARGAICVRGEAMELPAPLREKLTGASSVLASNDRREWLYFNAEPDTAQLCFVLAFAASENAPSTSLSEEITRFVNAHSRSLLVEHYYENSILDAESGLYSLPYATFTLKEKMLGGLPFATAIFRFGESSLDAATLSRVARAAIRVMREHFQAEEAPTVARGPGDTVLLVFNATKLGDSERAAKALSQLFQVYRSLGRTPRAAMIADTASCGTPARVMKIFERLLEKSASTNALELYTLKAQTNII